MGWIQQAHDKIQFGDGFPVQNTALNSFTLKKSGGFHLLLKPQFASDEGMFSMGLVSRRHNLRLQSQINRDFSTSESVCVFPTYRQHENAPKAVA